MNHILTLSFICCICSSAAAQQSSTVQVVCRGTLAADTDSKQKKEYKIEGASLAIDLSKRLVFHNGFMGACMSDSSPLLAISDESVHWQCQGKNEQVSWTSSNSINRLSGAFQTFGMVSTLNPVELGWKNQVISGQLRCEHGNRLF